MPSPEMICVQVRAALEHEPRINLHRYPIHLRCEDGILTVDGEVAHIVAKKLALELAAAVPGVEGLVDRLQVAPTRPMGDGAVRDHVSHAFLQEPAFATFAMTIWDKGQVDIVRPASGTPFGVIELTVVDGVVTLDGAVPSLSHKRLAGVLAWWVQGSRDVINGLAKVGTCVLIGMVFEAKGRHSACQPRRGPPLLGDMITFRPACRHCRMAPGTSNAVGLRGPWRRCDRLRHFRLRT